MSQARVAGWYNPGYTESVTFRKTAISVPDKTFTAADLLAKRLGLSRSQLYSKAVAEYVHVHRGDGLTEAINRAIEGEETSLEPDIAAMTYHSLKDRWEW